MSQRRWVKERPTSYTFLLTQACSDTDNAPTESEGRRWKRECLIGDAKVPCRSIEDYHYTKIGAHRCSCFSESRRDASTRIELRQSETVLLDRLQSSTWLHKQRCQTIPHLCRQQSTDNQI